jgi:ATP-dependent protease ClpP protease subunit
MRISPDMYNLYFHQHFDPANRRIFIVGDIGEDTLLNVTKALKFLESQSKSLIQIIISSEGGAAYDMLGLYDIMRASKCHLTTVGLGKIMSAGVLLLAAGDTRVCYPSTQFMIHEVQWASSRAGRGEHENFIQHMNQMDKLYHKLLETQTGTPVSTWMKLVASGKESYLSAVQALQLNIVDRILE